jgi:hypothetical protein
MFLVISSKINILHHDQVSFISGWFNICKLLNVVPHINRSKYKTHKIISIDAEKTINKIQYHLMIKALMKLGIEGMFLT